MQLRRDFLERFGRRIYGDRQFVVLGVVLGDPIEAVTAPDAAHVRTRTLRWLDWLSARLFQPTTSSLPT